VILGGVAWLPALSTTVPFPPASTCAWQVLTASGSVRLAHHVTRPGRGGLTVKTRAETPLKRPRMATDSTKEDRRK